MFSLRKLFLVLGVAVFVAAPAMAQRGAGPAALLANKAVQDELKLTEEEANKAKEALTKVQDSHKEDYAKISELKAEEQKKKRAQLDRIVAQEGMKALADVLKPEQLKRLRQIEIQQNVHQFGPGSFLSNDMKSVLNLTPDQKKKVAEIRDEFKKQRAGKSKDDLEKVRKDTMDKLLGVLTETQKTAWKEATGAAFELKAEAKPKKKAKE